LPKLPPTEALHPFAEKLDSRSVQEIVRKLHREDARAVRAVERAAPATARAAAAVAQCLAQGGRVFFVGAGTSGRLGALEAAECPPTFGTSPRQLVALLAGGERALARAVEGAEDDAGAGKRDIRARRVGPKDMVVGITASGRTPYVRGALAEAKRRRAFTALVTTSRGGPLEALASIAIVAETGPELLAGSTRLKAGTATKLILNALTTAAMVSLGKVYRGRMVDVRATNVKLKARAERIVRELSNVDAASARRLLSKADGSPRGALALHWGGAAKKPLGEMDPARRRTPVKR
jgi:N-acetylmuramic acid 6-phosphate etherase